MYDVLQKGKLKIQAGMIKTIRFELTLFPRGGNYGTRAVSIH